MQDSTNRSRERISEQRLTLRLPRLQAKTLKESLKTEVKATSANVKAACSMDAVFVESKSKKRTTCEHTVGSAGFEPTTDGPKVLPGALLIVLSIRLLASHIKLREI